MDIKDNYEYKTYKIKSQPMWTAEECRSVANLLQSIIETVEKGCGRLIEENEYVSTFILDYIKKLKQSKQWQGLTDEDIGLLWFEYKDALCLDHKIWARAVEAKLKDKNHG